MTAILLQVRLGSSRLPGKALKLIGEKPTVRWAMEALEAVPADLRVLVTEPRSIESLAPVASSLGWTTFVGPEDDVLKRYRLAIDQFRPDIVVRATGDNPMVTPELAVLTLQLLEESGSDYATLRGAPLGTGVEAFLASALRRADDETTDTYDREHVTPYIYRHPELFRVLLSDAPFWLRSPDSSVTLDTEYDFRFLETIYAHFGSLSVPADVLVSYLKSLSSGGESLQP